MPDMFSFRSVPVFPNGIVFKKNRNGSLNARQHTAAHTYQYVGLRADVLHVAVGAVLRRGQAAQRVTRVVVIRRPARGITLLVALRFSVSNIFKKRWPFLVSSRDRGQTEVDRTDKRFPDILSCT